MKKQKSKTSKSADIKLNKETLKDLNSQQEVKGGRLKLSAACATVGECVPSPGSMLTACNQNTCVCPL